MEVHMTKSKVIKKISAFIEGRAQSAVLDLDQLEQLRSLEGDAFYLWEGIAKLNDQLGNTSKKNIEEKLKKNE